MQASSLRNSTRAASSPPSALRLPFNAKDELKLCQGGIGVVYRVEDTSLKHKVLPEQFASAWKALALFQATFACNLLVWQR